MQKNIDDIVIFLLVVSALILVMVGFIVIILYMYRKKQVSFVQNLEQIKLNHEKNLLAAQLEMQETTFQHISREIHDNISLSLTLAKLQLNTFEWNDKEQSEGKIGTAIGLLSQSIKDLSDISKGLNADLIKQHGLIKAIEDEVQHIRQTGLFSINSILTGEPVYMDANKELIIFRIVQEAFNNIIKHSEARHSELSIHYDKATLYIAVSDDGNGFDATLTPANRQAGIKNMETRTKMLGGTMHINSEPGHGTILSLIIPFNDGKEQ
jgi:two-component system NarL family sensor kinase